MRRLRRSVGNVSTIGRQVEMEVSEIRFPLPIWLLAEYNAKLNKNLYTCTYIVIFTQLLGKKIFHVLFFPLSNFFPPQLFSISFMNTGTGALSWSPIVNGGLMDAWIHKKNIITTSHTSYHDQGQPSTGHPFVLRWTNL